MRKERFWYIVWRNVLAQPLLGGLECFGEERGREKDVLHTQSQLCVVISNG